MFSDTKGQVVMEIIKIHKHVTMLTSHGPLSSDASMCPGMSRAQAMSVGMASVQALPGVEQHIHTCDDI